MSKPKEVGNISSNDWDGETIKVSAEGLGIEKDKSQYLLPGSINLEG